MQEWQERISQPEFLRWIEFYKLYPFDDYHRFYRPAAMVASAASAPEALQDRLDWLQPKPVIGNYSEADMNTFKALGVKPSRG